MLISVGAKTVLAIPSQNKVIIAPPKKQLGIRIKGFEVLKADFTKCGTAIPTKEIGPANAVTQEESKLESKINIILNNLTFTPRFFA